MIKKSPRARKARKLALTQESIRVLSQPRLETIVAAGTAQSICYCDDSLNNTSCWTR